jgi:CheY-like chemotaxis protein
MVLDLGLPDMDGLSLLEKAKSQIKTPFPRVVVHTGRALTKEETRRLEAYSEAVILKDERSLERVLDEVRLFVRHVRETLPEGPLQGQVTDEAKDVSLANLKILLAEDDMRTVYALSALMRGKGAQVLVADNGAEALQLLDQHPDVDGVLMDIMMPKMDGYEAMRRLRTDPRFSALPVIALTAKAMKGEQERCLAAGASDYLTKPVDVARLLSALDKWLTKRDVIGNS